MARMAGCRVTNAFSTRLKLIWPRSSFKTTKMSKKKQFWQKSSRCRWVNTYEGWKNKTNFWIGIENTDIVKTYTYLGNKISSTGNFSPSIEHLREKTVHFLYLKTMCRLKRCFRKARKLLRPVKPYQHFRKCNIRELFSFANNNYYGTIVKA